MAAQSYLWLTHDFYVPQTLDVLTMLGFVILDRHGREQSDSDRAPVAQPHARRRHVAQRRDSRIDAHAHSADFHDDRDDGARPVAAGAVSRRRQRALSRPWAPCCWAGWSFRRSFPCCLIPALFSLTMDAKQWFVNLIFGKPPVVLKEPDATKPAVSRPQPALIPR